MGIAVAFIIWALAAAVIYFLFQVDTIYAAFYLISAALMTYGKLNMYKGKVDLVDELFGSFYGWTTLLIIWLTIPFTFFFISDEDAA
jgi:hypothetical protein